MPDVRTRLVRLRDRVDPRRGADHAELERLRARTARQQERIATLKGRVDKQQQRIETLRESRRALRQQVRRNETHPEAVTTAVGALPDTDRLGLRRRAVFASSPDDRVSVLEIGPAHNAILPKREGFNTRTVDYLDRTGLIERYKLHENYDPADIEEVDYVLPPGAAMAETIPDRFDLVVASHVIEHTTSMIDFLAECTRLLAPGGVLALVVPDHRYCFDRLRERTSIGDVIDAALTPRSVHTVGTVVEERLMSSRHGPTTAWAPGHRGTYSFIHDYDKVRAFADEARLGERYIDTHRWVSTPHHLRLLLQDLHGLGLTTLRECWFHDTVRHEFFLNLSVEGPGSGLSREELMALSDEERRSVDHVVFGESPV